MIIVLFCGWFGICPAPDTTNLPCRLYTIQVWVTASSKRSACPLWHLAGGQCRSIQVSFAECGILYGRGAQRGGEHGSPRIFNSGWSCWETLRVEKHSQRKQKENHEAEQRQRQRLHLGQRHHLGQRPQSPEVEVQMLRARQRPRGRQQHPSRKQVPKGKQLPGRKRRQPPRQRLLMSLKSLRSVNPSRKGSREHPRHQQPMRRSVSLPHMWHTTTSTPALTDEVWLCLQETLPWQSAKVAKRLTISKLMVPSMACVAFFEQSPGVSRWNRNPCKIFMIKKWGLATACLIERLWVPQNLYISIYFFIRNIMWHLISI